MKISESINRKNVVIAIVCVLLVAVCVLTAVFFLSQRRYQTVEGLASGESGSLSQTGDPSESAGPSGQADGTGNSVLDEQGISVTLQAELPEGLDPLRYVKQAYELKNLMAVSSFQSAADIPVNPAVQYAFCYLYTGEDCLVDFETGAMTYREATESEIREQIISLFGDCPFDIKQSDLYASGKQSFEMWQPNYSGNVYATAKLTAAEDGAYQIEISFFEDAGKTETAGTSVITVKPAENGSYYLASMT